MPKLNIFNEKGELDVFSGARLSALMIHPNDKTKREEYLVWLIVNHIQRGQEPDAEKLWFNSDFIKCGGAKRLINAPSFNEVMDRASKFQSHAEIAGLLIYLIIHVRNEPKFSKFGVNKARKLIESILEITGKKQDRLKTRAILNYWKEYKTVAHLWAAHFTFVMQKNKKKLIKKNIPPLLALSEEIRKVGENIKWHPNKSSLLPKRKMWTPPKDFLLPPAEGLTRKVPPGLKNILTNIK